MCEAMVNASGRARRIARVAGVMAALAQACGSAAAADLRRYPAPPAPPLVHPETRYPETRYPVDPGPASSNGYYGYYGTDIVGVPYGGLYSANVICLRSVPTPYGYRTVDVCDP